MSDPLVGVIMGSKHDWYHMKFVSKTLDELLIPHETKIVSAHRTPDHMFRYASTAWERGLHVIIAGAGGAAHLPGMVAAKTVLPVIGVPIRSFTLQGMDALLSIVQMPSGTPVATVGVGLGGAINAALLAASILGVKYPRFYDALLVRRTKETQDVMQELDPRELYPDQEEEEQIDLTAQLMQQATAPAE